MENKKNNTAENVLSQGKKMIEEATDSAKDYAEHAQDSIKSLSPPDEATAFLSPSTWIMLALGSMVLSIIGEAKAKRKEPGNFFGLWAPCFLIMGIYSKIQRKD